MNIIFLVSVVLKGIGAVLEILLQIVITAQIGVAGYGTYSTWVNAADLIFWICFSGLVKCNTFYLSEKDSSINKFKHKYYGIYVVPILVVGILIATLVGKNMMLFYIFVITGLELLVLDGSSTMLARGQSVISLIGEYVLGRTVLVMGVLVLSYLEQLNLLTLLTLYCFQYLLVLIFFFWRKKKNHLYHDISEKVSIKKWGAYQQADLMHSMIEQMPVVLQYFFAGAFEAGVVSVVLLVKKLINFISGPTAKIFLPEFSRLYHLGEKEKLKECYSSIMRIQMLFVGPMSVVLLGYPKVILGILATELIEYAWLFMICSIIFLLAATLGPCGGILQMTGNEKMDNRCRMVALLAMLIIMLLTNKDSYFVLYGLCGQIALEAVLKYTYVCKWMEKTPVTISTYLKWWLIPCCVIGITYILNWQMSFAAMVLMAGLTFGIGALIELKNEKNNLLYYFKEKGRK